VELLWVILLIDWPSSKEKKYAHYISEASWAGARIIQGQWTPQAQKLYDLLVLTFSDKSKCKLGQLRALQNDAGLGADEWEDLMQYTYAG
jgi:dipeptidyl-peptidase-3